MKNLKKLILISFSVLVFNYQASAAYFDGIYIFGDSLSDSGAYVGNPDAGLGGKFTTNPGPVWTEILGANYGLDVVSNNPNNPNTSPTGNNYAQGGAQVTNPIGIGQTVSPQSAIPIAGQISNYLATSPTANPYGLYTVWGGANDLFFNAGLVGGGFADIPTAINNMAGSAASLVGQVERLLTVGAGTVLVPNLPDAGETPSVIFSGIQAVGNSIGASPAALGNAYFAAGTALHAPGSTPEEQFAVQDYAIALAAAELGVPTGILAGAVDDTRGLFSALSFYYNDFLEDFLSFAPENVILLDIESLFADALYNPAAFGLFNVTASACNTASSLSCTAADLAYPGADLALLFADGVHPTTAGHALIADFAFDALGGGATLVPEPSVLFLLGPAFGFLALRRRKTAA